MDNSNYNSTTGSNTKLLLVGVGLSIIPNTSSTNQLEQVHSSQELLAIEAKFNSPIKSRMDDYIEQTYKVNYLERPKYSSIDSALVGLTQKFAEEQISLEPEFISALDELLASKRNKKPSRRRF